MTRNRVISILRDSAIVTLFGTIGITWGGLLWNSVFGTTYSLWSLITYGVGLGILMFIFGVIDDVLGLKWIPDRSKHRKRLAELQDERERLAPGRD